MTAVRFNNLRRFVAAITGLLLFCGPGLMPQLRADLKDQLQPLIEAHHGDVAVYVRHLDSGEDYHWRADTVQPTASLIKLAVMITAYRMADAGQLDLNKQITLTEGDKVPGSGVLTDHFSPGLTLSVRDAIRLMIRYSDNTATNLVVDQIGLPATAATLEELGFPNTKLHSQVFRGTTSIFPERSKEFGLGSTTARETVDLLARLYQSQIASEASCKAMLDHLLQCDDDTKVGSQLPTGTKYANKTGAVNASRCDAGILFGPKGPIAICVLTTNNEDKSWKDDNTAHQLCGRIGEIVFRHFNPSSRQGSSVTDDPLRSGASGELVEMLQRTLNQRLNLAPGLSVDGDFGPATETVVRQFQESASLPVTGIADAALWKALGPVAEPQPVPAPEIVNAAEFSRRPADAFDDPPPVTCKAWSIVDESDGKTLWSHEADRPVDIASTTKIMTAWLVIRHAQKHPEILDEILTMSDRADQTLGSTSALRSGEQVSVREGLYGLLLPSGNDMSVALAEHFGARFARSAETAATDESEPSEEVDPLDLFVTAMNDEAARLGLDGTHFDNPHGLTSPTHLSTAANLAILARTAFSDPLLRQYVGTRKRGATAVSVSGYQRHVLWENTNQLLEIEGYQGLKTGTTEKAGACLVSVGERNGRRLIVVVLGSAASASRYADSRNLYRWAWQQLEATSPTPAPR